MELTCNGEENFSLMKASYKICEFLWSNTHSNNMWVIFPNSPHSQFLSGLTLICPKCAGELQWLLRSRFNVVISLRLSFSLWNQGLDKGCSKCKLKLSPLTLSISFHFMLQAFQILCFNLGKNSLKLNLISIGGSNLATLAIWSATSLYLMPQWLGIQHRWTSLFCLLINNINLFLTCKVI